MRGIYLVDPHPRLIVLGLKKAIVKSKEFQIEGELLILLDREYAWGVIELGSPEAITIAEFSRRYDEHRIREDERKNWWSGKSKLYLYPIVSFTRYKEPRPYNRPTGLQTFLSTVAFKTEEEMTEKMPIAEINPKVLSNVTNEELLTMNHRIHQIYGAFFDGNSKTTADGLSREDLVNAAIFLWREMISRGMNISTDTPLHEEVTRFLGVEITAIPKQYELVCRRKQSADSACWYHRDLDGITAAAVLYRALNSDVDLFDINYGEEFPFDKVKQYSHVYMVDFALQPIDQMMRLRDICEAYDIKLSWIDHHKEALDSAKKAKLTIEGLQRVGQAGCELTWEYFHSDNEIPPIVKYMGRYDVWDHSDEKTLPIHYAVEGIEASTDPKSDFWDDWLRKTSSSDFSTLVRRGEIIKEWYDKVNAEVMAQISFDLDWEKLHCIVACTAVRGSEQFKKVSQGYDAAVVFFYAPKGQWHVGMYALKSSVDVGVICSKYGGGGHKGSGGFQVKKLPFSLPAEMKKRTTAIIHSGTYGLLPEIHLAQVTQHYQKPMILRSPAVSVVGSICNQQTTKNDIDILVHGPLGKALRQVVEFRLGRALPGPLSSRVQFHDQSLGGPFTDHTHVYDLALIPREDSHKVIQMALEKQSDPTMDWPKKKGPLDAVVQLHSRGRSIHTDLRFRTDGYLIGWTLFSQKAGQAPDVNTVSQLRSLYEGYTVKDGNRYFKPILAPAKQQAGSKLRQNTEWLEISGRTFGEGEVGSTSREEGVLVAVERPYVEWGLQLPHFHEYFLFKDKSKQWVGPLYFRMLIGSATEEDSTRTGEGKPFWTAHLSKNALPSVLKTRSVEKGHMPPDGRSAMPTTLEIVTPNEFKFWEARGVEARKIRDELVKSRFFTEANVEIVDGVFQRVVRKTYLYLPDSPPAEKARKRFALSWLYWRGPTVVRTGPSRQVWLLMIDDDKGLRAWELQNDILAAKEGVSAIERKFSGKALLTADQKLDPGEAIEGNVLNDTKDTPAWISPVASGQVEVKEETPQRLVLQFDSDKLKGMWALTQEEPGSKIWTIERVVNTSKADGEDPIAPSRKQLKPGDRFRPMKPEGGKGVGEFDEVKPILDKWLDGAKLKAGVYVEPKWNGLRVIVSRDDSKPDGKKVSVFFEDSKDERANILPSLAKEVDSLGGSFILDGELLDTAEDGSVLPRSSLARFTGPVDVQDDKGVRVKVFRVLYWDKKKGQLVEEDEDQQSETLRVFFNRSLKHLGLTPRYRVDSEVNLKKAIDKVRDLPGSEGAMLKLADSTYSLGGGSSSWVKLKTVRRILALVYEKDPVKGSKNTWNYSCAVGPIRDSDGFKESETVELGGKLWAVIGRTANTNVQASVGDIIQATVYELQVDKKPGERRIHWFGPPTVELLRDDIKRPMSVADVEALATDMEIRKILVRAQSEVIPLYKTERTKEERFVLGVVLQPNDGKDGAPLDPDSQNDIYSKEEIRQACHVFMERYQNVGLMHRSMVNDKVKIVECYLAPVTFDITDTYGKKRTIREGAWLLGLHILNDKLWAKVKRNEISGLSIGGSGRRVPEKDVKLS